MNRRLKKYMDDIDKVEKKIAEYQEQLQILMAGLKQEQELEMVRTLRSLNLDRRELFSVLNGLQDGTMTISDLEKLGAGSEEAEDDPAVEESLTPEDTDEQDSNVDEDSKESHWQEGGRYEFN